MDVLAILSNILPIVLIFIFVGVFISIMELCTNSRAKEIIRGNPSVVPSPSVLVNVYGGGQPAAAKEAARGGSGAAKGGGSGGGNKVVSDGSKVGTKVVTISIDGTSGKVNTTTTTLHSSNNGSTDKCGICKKAILLEPASVNGGVRANGGGGAAKNGGCGDGSKVVSDGSKGGAKVVTIIIDGTNDKAILLGPQ
uniref:Keratin, type I cytoskeletal 9-like n=1 Tax=Nicotiana tabacum TaxID=4097 RepID=A0A1S4CE92_TOBAC|nr:PREDICTED: keratin, type I cytoskeletal 9-like [Nicotiana tabacum]